MKTGIRFTVKHEIRGRIRIHLTRGRLSIRQADLFSFYLASLMRFIEMMPIGYGKQFQGIDHRTLLLQLKEMYPDLETDHRRYLLQHA